MEFFFGWLIKGRCYVSLLDIIMFLLELGTVIILGVCISKLKKKSTKRKT